MREPLRKKVDLCSVVRATEMNRAQLEYYGRVLNDPENEQRVAAQVCQVCHYRGRVGGTACTSQQCAFCETVMRFGNTCTDVLCQPCAAAKRLCKHCGGDIDTKNRRKL